MSKKWTLDHDIFLVTYAGEKAGDGIDPDYIASHDLGHKAKNAGTNRLKRLADLEVAAKIAAFQRAKTVMGCFHTLAFSRSEEARVIASETLEEMGEPLPKWLDADLDEAVRYRSMEE